MRITLCCPVWVTAEGVSPDAGPRSVHPVGLPTLASPPPTVSLDVPVTLTSTASRKLRLQGLRTQKAFRHC